MPKYSEAKKLLIDNLIKDKVYEEGIRLLQEERKGLFSMGELAARIGVSKATLYNYFTDKYEVIFYLTDRIVNLGEATLVELLNSDMDYRTGLFLAIKQLYTNYKEYKYIFAAATIARMEQYEKQPKEIKLPGSKVQKLIHAYFAQGVAKGELVPESNELLHKYLLIILYGLNMHPYTQLKGTPLYEELPEETVDKIIRYAVDGICRK